MTPTRLGRGQPRLSPWRAPDGVQPGLAPTCAAEVDGGCDADASPPSAVRRGLRRRRVGVRGWPASPPGGGHRWRLPLRRGPAVLDGVCGCDASQPARVVDDGGDTLGRGCRGSLRRMAALECRRPSQGRAGAVTLALVPLGAHELRHERQERRLVVSSGASASPAPSAPGDCRSTCGELPWRAVDSLRRRCGGGGRFPASPLCFAGGSSAAVSSARGGRGCAVSVLMVAAGIERGWHLAWACRCVGRLVARTAILMRCEAQKCCSLARGPGRVDGGLRRRFDPVVGLVA